MHPNTLADAVERIRAGSAQDVVLAEFVDMFDWQKPIGIAMRRSSGSRN